MALLLFKEKKCVSRLDIIEKKTADMNRTIVMNISQQLCLKHVEIPNYYRSLIIDPIDDTLGLEIFGRLV